MGNSKFPVYGMQAAGTMIDCVIKRRIDFPMPATAMVDAMPVILVIDVMEEG